MIYRQVFCLLGQQLIVWQQHTGTHYAHSGYSGQEQAATVGEQGISKPCQEADQRGASKEDTSFAYHFKSCVLLIWHSLIY